MNYYDPENIKVGDYVVVSHIYDYIQKVKKVTDRYFVLECGRKFRKTTGFEIGGCRRLFNWENND